MVKILCHNVFWFQGVPFSPEMPGEPQAEFFQALTRLYRGLSADVICLQEIQSEAVFCRLCEAMGMEGAYCPGRQLQQYGGVILWRSGKGLVDSREAEDAPQRMWQVVQAGGFRVCNVHLPSARQLGKEVAMKRRVEELAEAVVEKPEVVTGDFNEAPGGPVGEFLAAKGYVDAAVLTGKADQPTSLGGKRGDQIWVQEAVQDRVTEYSVYPVEDFEIDLEDKTHLSDHLPLWLEMEGDL